MSLHPLSVFKKQRSSTDLSPHPEIRGSQKLIKSASLLAATVCPKIGSGVPMCRR